MADNKSNVKPPELSEEDRLLIKVESLEKSLFEQYKQLEFYKGLVKQLTTYKGDFS